MCVCDILTHRLLRRPGKLYAILISVVYIGTIIIYDVYLRTRFADSGLTAVCIGCESPSAISSSGPTAGMNIILLLYYHHRQYCLYCYEQRKRPMAFSGSVVGCHKWPNCRGRTIMIGAVSRIFFPGWRKLVFDKFKKLLSNGFQWELHRKASIT